MSATDTSALPDDAPVTRSALGPALNEQGYYVGRVERNLYWVSDGTYQSAFLTTSDGVVLLDAPPTIGHNIQRAIDEIASAPGISNELTHLIYSHRHAADVLVAEPDEPTLRTFIEEAAPQVRERVAEYRAATPLPIQENAQ